jgi:hypothetical protein
VIRRTLLVATLILALAGCTGTPDLVEHLDESGFSMRVLTDGLANPLEMIWGPDDYLWVTEKAAGKVDRISPTDGTVTTALTLPDLLYDAGAQDGLLGLALHPSLLKQDTDQYPATVLPWWRLGMVAVVLLTAVAVVVPIESATRRRRRLSEVLRAGEA